MNSEAQMGAVNYKEGRQRQEIKEQDIHKEKQVSKLNCKGKAERELIQRQKRRRHKQWRKIQAYEVLSIKI